MGKISLFKKKQRIISVFLISIIAIYFVCNFVSVSSPLRYTQHVYNRVKQHIGNDILTRVGVKGFVDTGIKPTSEFEFFQGAARMPKISEDLFPKPRYDRKYFIYDCSQMMCGGLGDRQEGIVAAYLIAQMMGRRFGVIMTIPCDLSLVLEENKESWIVQKGTLDGLSVLPFKVLDHDAWKLRSSINETALEARFPQDAVLFNVNQEFVQYLMKMQRFSDLKWAENRTVTDIYNIVMRRLFKLKPKYQERFDAFQNSVRKEGRQLICAHVRLHDYRNTDYHVDPKTSEYVNNTWTFLKRYNNSQSYRIFVSTNANLVRKEAKTLFRDTLVDVDGPLIHVDENVHDDGCEGLAKTILDQMVLATCDVLQMSDSGFGRVAAMMRGTDDNLYDNIGKFSYSHKNFIPSYW